ncbi:uncharacterized protein TRIADDRAFT_57259 [Trichoplax adhaerens]|uniref:Vacuolar protein sorting-associated protein 33A n=1 Tax=Trichoplax adhaerens TaxID=10228 RepID=B3RYY4_TRIAD|nr:hypothetical protein TRIADDRAFT_57259 [Trichoplax adhaerens]EDV24105.1 hypothetical protein TRIADDRAFT_57259 [Trichoplax adhaerens]|eukprot:XP_002113631.1 hypothetical protein TRIADDRAFT_57259 [Trichoplax adhaerens]
MATNSSFAHLSTSGRVNLGIVRDASRRELSECLRQCPGSKTVVWDEYLFDPLDLVAEFSLLQELEVRKMFPLAPGRLPPHDQQNIIFFTRPKLSLMKWVAENVASEMKKSRTKYDVKFSLFFVPRKSLLCEDKLKELEVFADFEVIGEFNLLLLLFDYDLMSLELELAFRECHLEEDYSSLYYVARSLMILQTIFGTIPKIIYKGNCGKRVANMIVRMRKETSGPDDQTKSQISRLILVDRTVDLITPVLSQLTYEGLIDEHVGLKCTKFPGELLKQRDHGSANPEEDTQSAAIRQTVRLNSGDNLYAEIRDLNFQAVPPILSRQAKKISAAYAERHDAVSVNQIKQFVTKLPSIQAAKKSLANHTTIAEMLKKITDDSAFRDKLQFEQEMIATVDIDKINMYIEELLATGQPITKVLRLICLQSLVSNGLKPKLFEFYCKEILQAYGYEYLPTLINLEKVGLLTTQQPKIFSSIRKALRLLVDDINEQQPTDISFAYSGYAPLSVRLAQYFTEDKQSWKGVEEVLKTIPGEFSEIAQQIPGGLSDKGMEKNDTTLVFFIGGCTYAEIAALRFLSKQEEGNDFIIATTKLLNGTSLLETLIDDMSKAAAKSN